MYSTGSYFTTGAGATDVTPPSLVLVTPADGAAQVPVRAPVVLTFSEPLDPATVTTDTMTLYADGVRLLPSLQRSTDNTVVTLSATLPAGSWVDVFVTSAVRDLAGNALADVSSGFQVEAAADLTRPQVVGGRPGTGATGVGATTPVVLLFSEPVDPATLAAASSWRRTATWRTGRWRSAGVGRL